MVSRAYLADLRAAFSGAGPVACGAGERWLAVGPDGRARGCRAGPAVGRPLDVAQVPADVGTGCGSPCVCLFDDYHEATERRDRPVRTLARAAWRTLRR